MDNFVCWRCEREARGAFMLMGRPAEKWLVDRARQVELRSGRRRRACGGVSLRGR